MLHSIRKLRPYSLRKLRRLRRLRRLRLIGINLYLHRSLNAEKIQKDQENQGRNHSTIILSSNNLANYANLPQVAERIVNTPAFGAATVHSINSINS